MINIILCGGSGTRLWPVSRSLLPKQFVKRDEKKLVRPNESTYISMGQIHRLENEGKIPVILIEAQVGEYTGEDDIVRYDDIYGRENIRN